MVLTEWEAVENFVETVEKHLKVKIEFVSIFHNAYIYYIPSVDNETLNQIEDYVVFRLLPGMPCLD